MDGAMVLFGSRVFLKILNWKFWKTENLSLIKLCLEKGPYRSD